MQLGLRGVVALSILLLVGCHKKQPVITAPSTTSSPPPSPAPTPVPPVPSPAAVAMDAANREFALGDYPAAVRDYSRYLELEPVGGSRDLALFRLGLISALPGQQDWPRAGSFLNQLLSEFPQSPLRPEAQLILSLRDQSVQLSTDLSRLNSEAAGLRTEVTQLNSTATQSKEEVTRLTAERDALRNRAAQQEEKIKQLNADLERLIRIDTQKPRPNL